MIMSPSKSYIQHALKTVYIGAFFSNFSTCRYWNKFANWSAFNASNMLEVLTDDAIPTLQTALGTLWNSSNTAVYFDFLKNVRRISVALAL